MKRRDFMIKSGAAGAGLVMTNLIQNKTFAKNDEVTLAIIGIHGQGQSHLQHFANIPGVRIKTICDVDENLYPDAEKLAKENGINKIHFEFDLRRVLEDKDIDAITIATPEHWHALMTIWACQAGKDVYVEKPVSHNIWEGRKSVQAARKYNRIVAAGTQQRSYPHVQKAMQLLQEGIIGNVYMAKGLCYKPRESIGKKLNAPVPAGVHYDLWLGPAQVHPFTENRFHYNWHWFWDYGCGDIGNQGVHEMDVAFWGLNKNELPKKIYSNGGYYAFESDQETPNTQLAVFEWDDGKILQFEVRGLYTNNENGTTIGNLFYGTEGWMHVDISGFQTYLGRKNEPGPAMEAVVTTKMQAIGAPEGFNEGHFHSSSRIMHRANFINAVRSRQMTDLNADILLGHQSSALCHLANISYRLGRELVFDAYTEKFVNDQQANAYLKRNDRYPYVVPEEV